MAPTEEAPKTAEGIKELKKKQVDKWILKGFNNPARTDGTQLVHWVKTKEESEIYPFAKFNRKAEVVKYSDTEYNQSVAPLISDWDRLETDVLFDLCERFDLRFINIADRLSEEVADRIIE